MPINTVPIKKVPLSKEYDKKREQLFMNTKPQYSFDDIVLPESIRKEIDNLLALDIYRGVIFDAWGLNRVIKNKKNITANLYGESGTGKTMTAHAIAKELNKQLLIVNYSEIESKYVGETSKNIVNLFKEATKQDAIILFDEADALLSKRVTMMQSATDVSVNQTRNVLLQLLDEYEGIVIFTTNFIHNFDFAFFRRIMAHIKFELPDKMLRRRLWNHYLVDTLPIEGDKKYFAEKLSEIESVTGSDISNIVLQTAICAARENKERITLVDFKSITEKVISNKKYIESGKYEISTRKVSENFVKEKLGKDIIGNGTD